MTRAYCRTGFLGYVYSLRLDDGAEAFAGADVAHRKAFADLEACDVEFLGGDGFFVDALELRREPAV